MHPYLIVITMSILFLGAVCWLIAAENRRQRQQLLRRFREEFGAAAPHSYTAEELQMLSSMSRRRDVEKRGYLDDITWNDLQMDEIFSRVNQTLSAPGEELLYRLMRLPGDEEEIRRLDEMADFFSDNQPAREELQLLLYAVGKDRRFSVADTAEALDGAPSVSWVPHLIQALALAAAAALLPVFPVAAVFAVFVLIVFNAVTYQSGMDRRKTEAYRSFFSSLRRILDSGKALEKAAWPQIQESSREIARIRRELSGFQKKVFWFSGRQEARGSFTDLILDYLKMLFHIDLIIYPFLLRESREHQEDFQRLLRMTGQLDAAIAIASFRRQLPWYAKPVFSDEFSLEAENLYHPLVENPVANSMCTKGRVLLTGSNASGKSTFLKAVAVNAVLAQTLHTCTASAYRAPRCRVYSSIALRDSIQDGESYFMAEIRSLKRIIDAAKEASPVLCVIDEVLRGTNTVERIAASSRILQALAKGPVFCFAATHDLELTSILKNYYENYHFEEKVWNEDVRFEYRLKNGPSSSRNALTLLKTTGYEEAVVNSARADAEEFETSGTWNVLNSEKET